MCECGCSAFCPTAWLPGPGDLVYLLTSYGSCEECETPAGVSIDRMTRSKAESDWGVDFKRLPELEGDSPALPVIDPLVLRKHLAKWAKTAKGYDVAGALDDATSECFRAAATETVVEWEKSARPTPAKKGGRR